MPPPAIPDTALPAPAARVMGVLNVTPDSFSDGGRFLDRRRAVEHGLRMCEEGADYVDVGGESTRPGARAVSEAEELDRIIPVIEALRARVPVVISVDTSRAAVVREAAAAGAGLVNDVRALREEGALAAAAEAGVAVCLMHMQGEPRTMQEAPRYGDVVAEVRDFLRERARACLAVGIPAERILIDPGFGFGKTLDHNLRLVAGLPRLAALGHAVLVGVSRKSMIGAITGRAVDRRLPGSLALAVVAAAGGARVLRVHDVAETVDALRVATAVAAHAAAPGAPAGEARASGC